MLILRICCIAPVLLPILCLILILLFTVTNANKPAPYGSLEQQKVTGQLIFAHVIFRHGDRTPIDLYPTDPWKNPELWPTGWGQLTNRGKQQHYELGKWLRRRYATLLPTKYNKNDIYIQSTDVDRTLMSAYSNLAGLYEPVDADVWRNDIKWQPIPVHTLPERSDPILAGKAYCPAYDYALSALLDSPDFQAVNERFAYLFDYLTQHTGRVIDSLEGIQRLNNTFFIETLYNFTLPDWTKKVYPSADMSYISGLYFSINTYTRKMARLKAGPLIKEILQRFIDKWQNKLEPNRSVWIYSAHDTTIGNVLNALKMFELHSPPYTATIMLELRIIEPNEPFISIFYKNTTAEPRLMEIPGCGVACPLDKMLILYRDIIPNNWERECKLSTMMLTYEEANIGQATGILIAIIIILLLISYVLMIYFRRRSYRFYSHYSQMT